MTDFEVIHTIGFNHSFLNSLQTHPLYNETIVYSVGGIVITEDLNNKEKQVIFHHDKRQISSFRVSNSGRYLAVGFQSVNIEKSFPSNIVLWDYENKSKLFELTGIIKGVKSIEFSPDDRFVSGLGLDNSLFIWETQSGERVYQRLFEFTTNLIKWVRIFYVPEMKYPNYSIIVSNINSIFHWEFIFELKTMQYHMNYNKFSLPSSGLVRNFLSTVYDYENKSLLVGTSGGEVFFFSLENHVFKGSFSCITNGVTNLMLIGDGSFLITGGDGKVKRISKINNSYSVFSEISLTGYVSSLALIADKSEAVVSIPGQIYRVNLSNMDYVLHSEFPSMSINQICYGKDNETIYSTDNMGNVMQWDLNDYSIKNRISEKERVTSISIGDDNSIFIGLANGNIKNYDYFLSSFLWEMASHRGKVNSIFVNANYILSGGEDGVIRVWGRQNHEMIIQVPGHHKEVRGVIADNENPNIIYSGGDDKTLNSYDLKLQRRNQVHTLKNGFIFGIDQKKTGNREVLTVGFNSGLNVWDFFRQEPIVEIKLEKSYLCLKISNSGKYVAIGSEDGEVCLINVDDLSLINRKVAHSDKVLDIKWSYDDKQIVSSSSDGSICIWNIYID